MTIAGVPSGWSLSEGTDNGDGSWTVQTNNIAALTITSPGDYTGAMVFQVTQSWTNADGSSGSSTISDNVEVFAPGNPIFAISGDDTLTGSSGADLFVFAQPIGHDVVYNFDAAHDTIDLIAYAGFTSFADVAANLANDASGNATLTLGDGQSITLAGVDAGALNQSDFVFDQEPVTDNAGAMTVSDGAMLPLSGIVNNTGTIALDSTGSGTELELIQHGITLQGGGTLTLSDNSANAIFGTDPGVIFTNVDNTISGAGQLGNGQLTLVNEAAGTIDGNASGYVLVLDTGSNAVMNYGTIEATGGGGLEIKSDIINAGILYVDAGSTMLIDNSVANSGTMEISGTLDISGAVSGTGAIKIDSGAILEFGSASTATVIFTNNIGTTGELVLDDSKDFTGQIVGFAGDETTSNSDLIDIRDVNFANVAMDKTTYVDNGNGTGTLTLYDAEGQVLASIIFVGSYELASFTIESDGNGGILIADPPVQSTEHDGSFAGSVGGAVATDFSDTITGPQLTHDQQDGVPVYSGGEGGAKGIQDLIAALQLAQDLLHQNALGPGGSTENAAKGDGATTGLHDASSGFALPHGGPSYLADIDMGLKLPQGLQNGSVTNSAGNDITTGLHDTSTGLQLSLGPQDQNGLFSGLSGAQSFSFNFDALHSPMSNLPNIPGNFDHVELENALKSEIDQLQSLFHNEADSQPHDLFGHAEGIQTGGVQLSHLINHHQDGIFHP